MTGWGEKRSEDSSMSYLLKEFGEFLLPPLLKAAQHLATVAAMRLISRLYVAVAGEKLLIDRGLGHCARAAVIREGGKQQGVTPERRIQGAEFLQVGAEQGFRFFLRKYFSLFIFLPLLYEMAVAYERPMRSFVQSLVFLYDLHSFFKFGGFA